jgi:hypothetical protein
MFPIQTYSENKELCGSDRFEGDPTYILGRRTLFSYLARVRRQNDGRASNEAS